MTLYHDDPDVCVRDRITDTTGGTLDGTPTVLVDGRTAVTATWEGDPGPVRVLRTPLAGLDAGMHRLRFVVDGDNDLPLAGAYLS